MPHFRSSRTCYVTLSHLIFYLSCAVTLSFLLTYKMPDHVLGI